jgi:hypothetical protein
MLDVHAPHEAAHSWKDFLIHISTIVIGLLIAVGLEQTVEWIHHRHQVADTRRALSEEREHDIEQFAKETTMFRLETVRFQKNLEVLDFLQKHPRSETASLPGKINWHSFIGAYSDSAWQTAQHDNVTALMPQVEVRQDQQLYVQLGVLQASVEDRLRKLEVARRYMALDADPSHLDPQDLREAIHAAEDVLIAHYRLGSDMRNLHSDYSDFHPFPVNNELLGIVHETPMTAAK